MIKCPNCDSKISQDAIFCSVCGQRLDGKVVCSKCGREIKKDSTFCQYCGNIINKTAGAKQIIKRKLNWNKEKKSLSYNILILTFSVLFFIFSLLPVIKINYKSLFGGTVTTDISYKISIFNLFGAIPGMFNDVTLEEYMQEFTERLEDRVDSRVFSKIANGEELNRSEAMQLERAFNSCRVLEMILSREYIERTIASTVMFLLFMVLTIAIAIISLLFIILAVMGIVNKKIYKLSTYSFIIMISAYILLFFLLGKTGEMYKIDASPYVNIVFAFFGFVAALILTFFMEKVKMDFRGFAQRSFSLIIIAVLMLTFTANVISFNYNEDSSYKDREDFSSFITFTDGLLYSGFEPATKDDINQMVDNVNGLQYSQRKIVFESINSLNYGFSEDMEKNFYFVIVLNALSPLIYIGCFGLLLTLFILYLLQIQNNKYAHTLLHVILKLCGLFLLILNIAVLILFAVTYNYCSFELSVNMFVNLTAWPFICFALFIGYCIYGINKYRKSLPYVYRTELSQTGSELQNQNDTAAE